MVRNRNKMCASFDTIRRRMLKVSYRIGVINNCVYLNWLLFERNTVVATTNYLSCLLQNYFVCVYKENVDCSLREFFYQISRSK